MSGDLRAVVEGLPQTPEWADDTGTYIDTVDRSAVLALIPEGAVLVTEAELAAALRATLPMVVDLSMGVEDRAAAIMRHLREGT